MLIVLYKFILKKVNINIENNRRGKRLKDVTKIRNITKDMASQYGDNQKYAFLRDASMDSIFDPDENVKRKSENTSDGRRNALDLDSEGNQLTEAQQEFFKDSKVRDSKGRLLVMYHGTTANFNTFKKGDVMNAFTGYKFGFENIVFDTANYINDQTDLMEQALQFFGSHPEEEIEEDAASEESAEEK